jgi:hypothetical protein
VKNTFYIIGFLFIISLLVGCASRTTVKQVSVEETLDIQLGVDATPLKLEKIIVKIPQGENIGVAQHGWECPYDYPLQWVNNAYFKNEDLKEIFIEELNNASYLISDDEHTLFNDETEQKVDLLVGVIIKDIDADICYTSVTSGIPKGMAVVKVEWQIYSRAVKRIVYTTNTEGSSNPSTRGSAIFLNAFAAATQNLLADKAFHDLLVRKGENND